MAIDIILYPWDIPFLGDDGTSWNFMDLHGTSSHHPLLKTVDPISVANMD